MTFASCLNAASMARQLYCIISHLRESITVAFREKTIITRITPHTTITIPEADLVSCKKQLLRKGRG